MSDRNAAADSKNELVELMCQKRALIESLALLERQIFLFEASYLEDTAAYGNIIKGWERYLLTSSSGTSAFSAAAVANGGLGGAGDKRVRKFRDSDRLFSRSSVTSLAYNNPHYYETEKSVNPATNDNFADSQYFDSSDNPAMDDSKNQPQGFSGKKKRKHR